MTTHISVLPTELLDTLSIRLGEHTAHQLAPDLSLLRLPHPRTGLPALFLPVVSSAGESSILELQNVVPNATRSWFNGGEVLSDGSMLLGTRVDPVFLLVPILQAAAPRDGSLGNYRTLDDILEGALVKLAKEEGTSGTVELIPGDILELSRLPCVEEAVRKICEAKDIASDLVVFRYSHPKLLEYLMKKVTRLGNGGFVANSRTLERELAKDGLMDDDKEELLQSGQLKLACDLVSQYVSQDLHEELLGKFDFSALTQHLATLKDADFIPDATVSNGNAQKVQANEDQDGSIGKKRRVVGQESTGVAKLKKANVKGMAKLSSFFQKKS